MQIDTVDQNIEKLQKLRSFAQPDEWAIPIQKDGAKRAFDIFFSLFILILFFPLFISLIVLVRFTSPGPVFYKSRRLGIGGKAIDCWKFRSMYQDAEKKLKDLLKEDPLFRKEWEAFQKVKKDPRITPVGRFLRKTSLDELPQFWNVLKGDLSIVGPRPPTLMGPPENSLHEIFQLYGQRAKTILSVRPGITGVWQISGRSHISFEERSKMEEQYALNRSFGKDLVVILKTIPAVLFSKGAF